MTPRTNQGPAKVKSAANSLIIDQPIVTLDTGMCVGFESLVRWTRNGKPVPPSTFVPIAEELGVIDTMGNWVLEQACQTFADWQRRFPSEQGVSTGTQGNLVCADL